MEDEPVNTTWRIAFAWISLGFMGSVIWYLLLYGKGDNSLHSSALSWSYFITGVVLAGVGFGQVAHLLPSLFGKTTPTSTPPPAGT